MEPIEELETRIRGSYKLVCDYESIRQDTDSLEEKDRCEREIKGQWDLIKSYLEELFNICRNLSKLVPEDIRQIAAQLDFREAYATLQRVVPEDVDALDQLIRVLRELAHLHEHLQEGKELHNLLQECITPLIIMKGELEVAIEHPNRWNKVTGRRLWGPCRTQLHRLESFAQGIKYTGSPFRRDEGVVRGPPWMITIATLREEFEVCLKEGDVATIYDSTLTLWDACYDALYQADKRLRDMVVELYMLSNSILRSVKNDLDNG